MNIIISNKCSELFWNIKFCKLFVFSKAMFAYLGEKWKKIAYAHALKIKIHEHFEKDEFFSKKCSQFFLNADVILYEHANKMFALCTISKN